MTSEEAEELSMALEATALAREKEIRDRAFQIYLERVRNNELDDWLQAEREIREKHPA